MLVGRLEKYFCSHDHIVYICNGWKFKVREFVVNISMWLNNGDIKGVKLRILYAFDCNNDGL